MHCTIDKNNHFFLTQFSEHALKRMSQRGITREAVVLTLTYGRKVYGRGVKCYFIGKKELAAFAREGTDLSLAEGMHVVVSSRSTEQIITVYKNKQLPNIRPIIKRRG